jgi:glycosyltransferase involved in cell wall biosynthesis
MSENNAAISACILARNEEQRIEEALRSLQGWTDQIIVIDNESEDGTAAVARRYTGCILTAPRASNFDALRNLATELATGEWLFYLDADERVPPPLGPMLRDLVRQQGDAFEAVCIPFKHFFCGKWMEHSGWWPGYKGAQLLKKGCFRYNERLHGGAAVNGRTVFLSADNPDLAIVHYTYDDVDHYLDKLNRYTHGEAENLLADGASHSWQAHLAHFVQDWKLYYEQGRADLDGMHGFQLSFMGAFYRFACRAKLWDLRRQRGEVGDREPVPASLDEMLALMTQVIREGADRWIGLPGSGAAASAMEPSRVPLLWRGPIYDTSGFADEGRHFVLSLIEAGEPIAVASERWQDPDASLAPAVRSLISAHTVPSDSPTDLCVSHTLLHFQQPNPNARFNVARVMFEADRLPDGIADRLNWMDRIWVPSEFNREAFAKSGVAVEKIAVIPGAIDPLPYASALVEPWPVPGEEEFRFLSVFDWSLRKGWDVLVEAFAAEFEGEIQRTGPGHGAGGNPVGLVIKSSNPRYPAEEIRAQIDAHLRRALGRSLSEFPNIHLWQKTVPAEEMPRVYRAVDAFVLPTRGEGWCRPLMEAMAAGLPTIATGWSGLAEFHDETVGYPLRYEVRPVSAAAAAEAPCYAGRCWAEPSVSDLRRLMRLVVEDRATAQQKGAAAQQAIARGYSHRAVAAVMREELARCRALLEAKDPRSDTRMAGGSVDWAHAPAFGRRETLLRALEHLERICPGPPCIVETGTLRDAGEQARAGDGWSTIAWGWYATQKGGRAYTVDISAEALEVCRRVTADYAAALVHVQANSLDFFRGWSKEERGEIHLLYLDSLDYLDMAASEAHHLAEAQAALPLLASHCLVLFDDTAPLDRDDMAAPVFRGKGARAIPFLLAQGFRLEWAEGGQVLLSRGDPVHGAGTVEIVHGDLQSDPLPNGRPGVPQAVASSSQPTVPLLWRGPLFDASGYADEARQFVLGLIEAGEPVALAPDAWGPEIEQEPAERERLARRIVGGDTPAELCVRHTLLTLQRPSASARFNIARTMFETDRLPDGAAAALNGMDRIWVPSEFNRETFVRSGVVPEKIAVVPGSIDVSLFEERGAEPWPLPGGEPYRFLSVFDWTLHKGWDVLLGAFAAEFGGDPQVGLILKIWSSQRYTLDDMRAQAEAHLRESLGRSLSELPNIHFWQETLPARELPRMYQAVDAFVLPTRGEGWCRPLMEAMAVGLPTVATGWSGLTEFHNASVGYPLRYEAQPVAAAGAKEAPIYAGHAWAEPDMEDLRRLMRRLVNGPREGRARGSAARAAIAQQYSRGAVTARLREELDHCRRLAGAASPASLTGSRPATAVPAQRPIEQPSRPPANPIVRDPAPPVDYRTALGRPLRVRWEGDQSLLSSLARVNREFCLGLLAAGDVELTLAEATTSWHTLSGRDDPRFGDLFARRGAELSGPPDVTVRQYFPPDWRRPEHGKFIAIQPWEYGHLPCEWAAGARSEADEVWTHSRFVRDLYVRSGVPAEKVRIVPLGFDPAIFRPDGATYALPTTRSVRFLFVGGAIPRKGADLLLAAYQRAFTARDDVCLIVKDMGTRTFYQGMTYADAFRRAQADPSGPDVVYIDDDLTDPELAALYRACTCVVLPYRAEGFALPPLEGMACGRAAIVTAGGPTDDYLDDSMALRVPRRRRLAGRTSLGRCPASATPGSSSRTWAR